MGSNQITVGIMNYKLSTLLLPCACSLPSRRIYRIFGNLFQERLICIYDNLLGKGFQDTRSWLTRFWWGNLQTVPYSLPCFLLLTITAGRSSIIWDTLWIPFPISSAAEITDSYCPFQPSEVLYIKKSDNDEASPPPSHTSPPGYNPDCAPLVVSLRYSV